MINKAFILAAGLGTRLGSLTAEKPKALVPVNGVPMMELLINRLKMKGIDHFMVNVHHHARQVIDFINQKDHFGVRVEISDESGDLLDTGGAVKKASHFFPMDEPVLVHNVDVLTSPDLEDMTAELEKTRSTVLLSVRKRESARVLLFDKQMKLKGWVNLRDQQYKWVEGPQRSYQPFAFSGVYLVKREFIENIPFSGKFSIIDTFLRMAASFPVYGYLDHSPYWFDMGTKEKIAAAEQFLRDQGSKTDDE